MKLLIFMPETDVRSPHRRRSIESEKTGRTFEPFRRSLHLDEVAHRRVIEDYGEFSEEPFLAVFLVLHEHRKTNPFEDLNHAREVRKFRLMLRPDLDRTAVADRALESQKITISVLT